MGRALHQYRRGHGLESRSGLIFFFQVSIPQLLNVNHVFLSISHCYFTLSKDACSMSHTFTFPPSHPLTTRVSETYKVLQRNKSKKELRTPRSGNVLHVVLILVNSDTVRLLWDSQLSIKWPWKTRIAKERPIGFVKLQELPTQDLQSVCLSYFPVLKQKSQTLRVRDFSSKSTYFAKD